MGINVVNRVGSQISRIKINSVKGVEEAAKQGSFTVKMEESPVVKRQYVNWLIDKKQLSEENARKIAAKGIPQIFIDYINSLTKIKFRD